MPKGEQHKSLSLEVSDAKFLNMSPPLTSNHFPAVEKKAEICSIFPIHSPEVANLYQDDRKTLARV